MKFLMVFILFVIFPTSFAASPQNPLKTEQAITACSFITELEQMVRGCIEKEKDGENCVLGLGAGLNTPEDVKDILRALLTDMATSCEYTQTFVDFQCLLEKATSAKAEHCADSD